MTSLETCEEVFVVVAAVFEVFEFGLSAVAEMAKVVLCRMRDMSVLKISNRDRELSASFGLESDTLSLSSKMEMVYWSERLNFLFNFERKSDHFFESGTAIEKILVGASVSYTETIGVSCLARRMRLLSLFCCWYMMVLKSWSITSVLLV